VFSIDYLYTGAALNRKKCERFEFCLVTWNKPWEHAHRGGWDAPGIETCWNRSCVFSVESACPETSHFFNNPLNLHAFSMMKYFKFFNSVLTKNLEINNGFFRIFISKFLKFSKKFKFNRSGFAEPTKLNRADFISFHKNWPIFIGK
jgi:hypothetical protein